MSAPSASSLSSCPHAAEVERCGWSGWESLRLAGGCSSCEVPPRRQHGASGLSRQEHLVQDGSGSGRNQAGLSSKATAF